MRIKNLLITNFPYNKFLTLHSGIRKVNSFNNDIIMTTNFVYNSHVWNRFIEVNVTRVKDYISHIKSNVVYGIIDIVCSALNEIEKHTLNINNNKLTLYKLELILTNDINNTNMIVEEIIYNLFTVTGIILGYIYDMNDVKYNSVNTLGNNTVTFELRHDHGAYITNHNIKVLNDEKVIKLFANNNNSVYKMLLHPGFSYNMIFVIEKSEKDVFLQIIYIYDIEYSINDHKTND